MNHKYKQNFIRAGAIARDVRAYGKGLIRKGASYSDVVKNIYRKIDELGGTPAFPPQIALNHIAAHYLPYPGEEIVLSDEVVKLDVGICFEGAIGDCAVTVDLSGKYQGLIDAAEKALLNAEKSLRVGQPVRDIGKIIEETVVSLGFQPVRNLAGHGLGEYKVHTAPIIPNCDDQSRAVLKPGMTFAIEPFVTNGEGAIFESGAPTIFAFSSARPVHSHRARALLARIRAFNGLPFSIYDLIAGEWSVVEVQQGIDELMKGGVIAGYPPLLERKNGMVAQAENSVLIDEKGNIFITTR